MLSTLNKQRSIRLLTLLILLCILSVNFEISFVVKKELTSVPLDDLFRNRFTFLKSNQFMMQESSESAITQTARTLLSGLNITSGEIRSLKSANDAVEKGRKLWQELESAEKNRVMGADNLPDYNNLERCPYSVSISKDELTRKGNVTVLPCGLTLGSHITVIGKPRSAHVELEPNQEKHMVSQFTLELHGLKTVSEGENPPRILHFNPRLKGDWSGIPIIEHNTCYRMQWGTPQRCHGWSSTADKDTVDGFAKCEKWIIDDDGDGDGESKATTWWLKRLIRRGENLDMDWPFPFVEDKTFVLNLSAGFEGYHMSVDGRHVSSFPYGPAFTPEDATGLYVNGDVDVLSIFAASLPTSHTSFGPQKHLDLSDKWKAPPVPDGQVELLIGILSAGNHFAERMAVRKSWMQHELIKSSNVVARFFVALHERKGVNEEVKKEAEFFGDIVIVPYMDNYDLIVIKTVAICEYGVQSVSAKYIMKGDDDTFVRVDAIMNEVMKKNVESDGGLYVGKMNYYHVPLRTEWAEGVYPPYADGAAYIISSDIANSILSDFQKAQLRLFKMEDVSMGIWVEKFNKTRRVEFVHSMKFCQFGCVENYITAHYQSPRQMICLWNKLRRHGRPSCCNMR